MPLPRNCTNCGTELSETAKFCPECAHPVFSHVRAGASGSAGSTPLAAQAGDSGERRQLTVMFCDLVGSTALSEKLDPEELRALLHDYRTRCGEVIARYEGFVARYVGDGILTYFGWPKAHEEDAERAVRAGLEIVQAMKRASFSEPLSVRLGIATGPVVVGEQAGEGDQAKLAVGLTPNLASRLQGLASADQIVIAASTRGLVGSVFDLTDLGEHELKGISEPVRAWRVGGLAATEGRFEASRGAVTLTPFVGRDEELTLLLARWERAREGEGQVVLLCGEPGIGKSRITQALRERLANEPHTRLRYQCSPYHTHSVFHPFIEHLERSAGFARDDSADTKLNKLEALLGQTAAVPELGVSLIASLLSINTSGRYPPLEFSPQRQKEETVKLLAMHIARLAAQQPVVILFEDVHWIDPSALEVLDLMVDRVQQFNALLLITCRPEFQARWTQQSHVTPLTLNRLARKQAASMVERVTGGKALPVEVLNQIVAKTDGVPLFVEELTKAVLEGESLRERNGRYELIGPLTDLDIPATLQDSLMARLDRHALMKEVAQIGACIGRDFPFELVAEVSPLTQAQVIDSLSKLVESGLVHRSGHPPTATYIFKHALVQDVAYKSILKTTRTSFHEKIARAMLQHFPVLAKTQPEIIAHHYSQAGLHELAVPRWLEAGENELRKSSAQEAVAHLNKGLEETQTMAPSVPRDRLELDVRRALGTGCMAWKGWPSKEVKDAFEPAVKLGQTLGDNAALLPVLWGLSLREMTHTNFSRALEWAGEMIAAGRGDDSSDIAIMGHSSAVLTYFWMGELLLAREHADFVCREYDKARHRHLVYIANHDPKCVAQVWCSQVLWMLGFPDLAQKWCDEQLEISREQGHVFQLLFALTSGTGAYTYRREPDVVLARIGEALQGAKEHSLPIIEHFTAAEWSCRAYLEAGQPQAGFDLAIQAAEVWRQAGGSVSIPYLMSVAADALRQLGRDTEARSIIDQAIHDMQTTNEKVFLAEAYRIKGELARNGTPSDHELAHNCFEKALNIARAQSAKGWELRAAKSLAELWKAKGNRREAYQVLAPVYDWFTEGFDTKDLKEAKALLEELGA